MGQKPTQALEELQKWHKNHRDYKKSIGNMFEKSKHGYVARGSESHYISQKYEASQIPLGASTRDVSPRLYNPSHSDY